eukprot:m51a1_g14434 hypothetical protein (953) ;mRNA; r:531731-537451
MECARVERTKEEAIYTAHYSMIGVDLEHLMDYEQALYCEQTAPLIVRKVLSRLIRDGLGDPQLIAFLANVAANSHANSASGPALGERACMVAASAAQSSAARALGGAMAEMAESYWELFEAPRAPLTPERPVTEFVSFRRKLVGLAKPVGAMALAPGKQHVWTVDDTGEVLVWDARRCCLASRFGLPDWDSGKSPLFLASVGGQVWCCTSGGITIIDCETRTAVDVIPNVCAVSCTYVASRDEVWCGSRGSVLTFKRDGEPRAPGAARAWRLANTFKCSHGTFGALCVAFDDRVWCGNSEVCESNTVLEHELPALRNCILFRAAVAKAIRAQTKVLKAAISAADLEVGAPKKPQGAEQLNELLPVIDMAEELFRRLTKGLQRDNIAFKVLQWIRVLEMLIATDSQFRYKLLEWYTLTVQGLLYLIPTDKAPRHFACAYFHDGHSWREPMRLGLMYAMIGVDLEYLMEYERGLFGEQLAPLLVRKLLKRLIRDGLSQDLCDPVQPDAIQDLENDARQGLLDAIEVCESTQKLMALLVLWLRKLPSPLVPLRVRMAIKATKNIERGHGRLAAQVAAVNKLKPANRSVLGQLIALLANVAANAHISHANDFGSVLEDMATNYWELFEAPEAPLAPELPVIEFVTFRRKLGGLATPVRAMALGFKGNIWTVDGAGQAFVWIASRCTLAYTLSVPVCGDGPPLFLTNVAGQMWCGTADGITIIDCEKDTTADTIPNVCALSCTYVASRNEVLCGSKGCVLAFTRDGEPKAPGAGPTWRLAETVDDGSSQIFDALCLAYDGRVWCRGSDMSGRDSICVCERLDRKLKVSCLFDARIHKITSLASVGESVWVASDPGVISVWDAASCTKLRTFDAQGGDTIKLCALPDQVWSSGLAGEMRVWDPVTLQCIGEVVGAHTDTVTSMMACTDQLTGQYNCLSVWHARRVPSRANLNVFAGSQ